MSKGDYIEVWLADRPGPIVVRATKNGRRVRVARSRGAKWMTVEELTRGGRSTGNFVEAQVEHVRAIVTVKQED